MARLALFSIVLFSLSLSANAASSQQPLAYPDGSVRTTEGWSWTNCGQSSVSPLLTQLDALLSFQGLPTDSIQIESISVSPDPPKPGQNLTVTVEASTLEEVEVRLHTNILYSPDRIGPSFRRVHMQMLK
jgi:hypothetical protein